MNQIEKIIDIATWNRREHYEHFSAFDDPFFGVTVNVDCTRAYQEAKDKGVSFSLLVLHRIVTAAATVSKAIEWCVMTVFCPKPLWPVPTTPFLLLPLNTIRTNSSLFVGQKPRWNVCKPLRDSTKEVRFILTPFIIRLCRGSLSPI